MSNVNPVNEMQLSEILLYLNVYMADSRLVDCGKLGSILNPLPSTLKRLV